MVSAAFRHGTTTLSFIGPPRRERRLLREFAPCGIDRNSLRHFDESHSGMKTRRPSFPNASPDSEHLQLRRDLAALLHHASLQGRLHIRQPALIPMLSHRPSVAEEFGHRHKTKFFLELFQRAV